MFTKAKNDFDKIIGDLFTAKMRVDIIEHDNDFVLLVDLPGIKKDEVILEYADDCLTISINKGEIEDSDDYIKKERKDHYQERSFTIPSVDFNCCKATLDNGVLTILLPKIHLEGKKINVE